MSTLYINRSAFKKEYMMELCEALPFSTSSLRYMLLSNIHFISVQQNYVIAINMALLLTQQSYEHRYPKCFWSFFPKFRKVLTKNS